MLTRIAALTVFFIGLNAAFADQDLTILETCEIQTMTLDRNTQIYCAGDLKVTPGAVVTTNGKFLQIVSEGYAYLGDSEGLTIDSQGQAGMILIYVRNHVSGQLHILNEDAEDGFGGTIEITVGAMTEDYQQQIANGIGGDLTVIAGGILLKLEGPENTIARN